MCAPGMCKKDQHCKMEGLEGTYMITVKKMSKNTVSIGVQVRNIIRNYICLIVDLKLHNFKVKKVVNWVHFVFNSWHCIHGFSFYSTFLFTKILLMCIINLAMIFINMRLSVLFLVPVMLMKYAFILIDFIINYTGLTRACIWRVVCFQK